MIKKQTLTKQKIIIFFFVLGTKKNSINKMISLTFFDLYAYYSDPVPFISIFMRPVRYLVQKCVRMSDIYNNNMKKDLRNDTKEEKT